MCKHIPSAQVSVRAACCRRWFDCTQCHQELSDHDLFKTLELIVACKKCKKVFKKDLTRELEDSDEYCPHCDNHFVIEYKEPQPIVTVAGDDPRLVRDERMQQKNLAMSSLP